MISLCSCAEANAIKDGIKEKLPKPETVEVLEPIMDCPNITLEEDMTFLVVQEANKSAIIAVVDGTQNRYSLPNWFGDTTIEPGTYILVKHADNSLPTYPMQYGFIYAMTYFAKDGTTIDGVKS
jgi:hypothetical protein